MLTNNSVAGFNSSWAPNIPKSPSIWTVIEAFIREESLARVTHAEVLRNVQSGQNASRKRSHEIKMFHLLSICENFENTTPKDYLESISSLMSN